MDAIALELGRNSHTLTEADARRVAGALCGEAELAGTDPWLYVAIIQVESSTDHLAVSGRGAEGLMQLMPATPSWMARRTRIAWTREDAFDPVANARLGVRYFDYLRGGFACIEDVLTAYNRGPTTTRRLLSRYGTLPLAVTAFYSTKVLDTYHRLLAEYGELPTQSDGI